MSVFDPIWKGGQYAGMSAVLTFAWSTGRNALVNTVRNKMVNGVRNLQKFKNVLLYILERCAGKPNVGETVLYKLLYFSDFNYYEIYEEHLTTAKYRKLPYGPVPEELDMILIQMIEEGQLQRVKTEYHGYTHTRYLPLIKRSSLI